MRSLESIIEANKSPETNVDARVRSQFGLEMLAAHNAARAKAILAEVIANGRSPVYVREE